MSAVRKVAVALSGGVDSAVSALLVKRKGFDVCAVYMRNWDDADETGECSSGCDVEDARFICRTIGIPLREVSFVKEYWNEIFTYFLDSYQMGLNPNPDIMCNKRIKFDFFYKYATVNLGADAIATGHYARTSFGSYLERYKSGEKASLMRAFDRGKDQTFFLGQVPQEALRRTMFPVGELEKTAVRRIASENGLGKISKKRDSMGLCFVGRRHFPSFISDYIVPRPGRVINISTGRVEARHSGAQFWILGQKFPIPGVDKPRYVAKKAGESDLMVAAGRNHPALVCNLLYTSRPHWIRGEPDFEPCFDCDFKFQVKDKPVRCRAVSLNSGELVIALKYPLKQVNPGQFAVFYLGDECLGSAEITAVGPTYWSLGKKVNDDFKDVEDDREALEMFH